MHLHLERPLPLSLESFSTIDSIVSCVFPLLRACDCTYARRTHGSCHVISDSTKYVYVVLAENSVATTGMPFEFALVEQFFVISPPDLDAHSDHVACEVW